METSPISNSLRYLKNISALDPKYQSSPSVEKQMVKFFSQSWPSFVRDTVLANRDGRVEAELVEIGRQGVWVKHHWAPYWFTCGVCNLHPHLILKARNSFIQDTILNVFDFSV